MDTYFKFHAARRHTHSAIDATLALVKEHTISPENIKKINVKTYSLALGLVGKEYEPKTESTAKFSLPYCLAIAALDGKVGPNKFSLKKVGDPYTMELAKKVEAEADPELNELVPDKRVSIVEIVVGNGERYKLRVDYAKGEPENPASEEDLNNKFKLLASTILNENNLQEILTRINRIKNH